MSFTPQRASLLPLSGLEDLYHVARRIGSVDVAEIDAVRGRISPVVQRALLWMSGQLKDPIEARNPLHFGRLVTLSQHAIRFSTALDGELELMPVVSYDAPFFGEGWVRSIKLGAEFVGAEQFPPCPIGSWTDGLYMKLFTTPVVSDDDVMVASGYFLPLPASELYDPSQSLN